MKKHMSTILFSIIFITGLSVLLYPYASNLYNKRVSSYAIADYDGIIENTTEEEKEEIFERGEKYNTNLVNKPFSFEFTEEEKEEYLSQLTLSNYKDMMGYIEIGKINLNLPIYHGTSPAVLQVGVGHLEWTSLPIGGVGSHTVLTGHRGLPTAKLFTNLDKLLIGDVITIKVLDRTYYYEVKETEIVEPSQVNSLRAVQGKDLLTLVTCTPYGVNSHRLLIKCERTDKVNGNVAIIEGDATIVNPYIIAGVITLILLCISKVFSIIKRKRKNK